jgi:hypothetical protein
MGIRVDLKSARQRLIEAYDRARSDEPLPAEWLRVTEAIGVLRSKTFTPALGTALLARSTDDRINALCLKEQAGNRAYSARTVGHCVLVPFARQQRISLRATGREPLNNQPFFRYERVDQMEKVRYPDEHQALVEALERVNDLRTDEALLALAAFLRVRMSASDAEPRIDLRETPADLYKLLTASTVFLSEAAEGGRRAQALVAAVFDLAFEDVRTRRVNDPSRDVPGDVQVYQKLAPVLTVEVRAKLVNIADLNDFRDKVSSSPFPHGVVAAVASRQPRVDRMAIMRDAWSSYGFLLTVYVDFGDLLVDALAWGGRPLPDALQSYPGKALRRLEEMEVAGRSLQRWQELLLA